MELKSTYNCIVIDDEKFARDLIENLLKPFPDFYLVGKYKNTGLAKKALQDKHEIDIIFLDIQMPEESGIAFLKTNKIKPKIILTTAFLDYALEGFDLDVVDYLLKPITEQRFHKAIKKVKERIETEAKAKAYEISEIKNNDYLHIKSGASEHRLFFNELIRLEAYGEYIRYITTNKEYLVLGSLKNLISKLPAQFIQVHRSHIISLNEVKGREKYTLILNNLTEIPIGKTYRTWVLSKINI